MAAEQSLVESLGMMGNDFWLNKRVFLTGHTGFKGSWLLLWLLKLGAKVYGYSKRPESFSLYNHIDFERLSKEEFDANFVGIEGDILDLPNLTSAVDLAQPEIVFHLAAQPLVFQSYLDPVSTWEVNVQGSIHLLESLRSLNHHCAVVMITTDKVYKNREWSYGYREEDILGGHDPYSASKAAAELAISSWRDSFCTSTSLDSLDLSIATARAGNVIGGGDWADNRIIPDAINAIIKCKSIPVRNPSATRPWQHVLEPLSGYLLLAESLFKHNEKFCSSFNFGPSLFANKSVSELLEEIFIHWPGDWHQVDDMYPHEAGKLHLQTDKAFHDLAWSPQWNFHQTVEKTVKWYKDFHFGTSALECCVRDILNYSANE